MFGVVGSASNVMKLFVETKVAISDVRSTATGGNVGATGASVGAGVLRRVGNGVATGAATGLATGLVTGAATGLAVGFMTGAATGLAVGAGAVGLEIGLATGLAVGAGAGSFGIETDGIETEGWKKVGCPPDGASFIFRVVDTTAAITPHTAAKQRQTNVPTKYILRLGILSRSIPMQFFCWN